MATIKCKKCGASIVVEAGKNVVRCKACGTMQVVSNDNDKQKQFAKRRRLAARMGKTIAAGYWYSVGLKLDGTVVAVGANEREQCNTEAWTDVIAVSAGKNHTVGLNADGTVTVANSYFHILYLGAVDKWKDIIAIAAGNGHTVGLKKDGSVVTVGEIRDPNNEYGLHFFADGNVTLFSWRENAQCR